MMKVIVFGGSGRMGKAIADLVEESSVKHYELVGSISRKAANGYQQSSADWNEYQSWKADVVVDFSQPENLKHVLRFCLQQKTPLVSGTTGLSEEDKNSFKQASTQIPILWSPNMSVGVFVVKKALHAFSGQTDYDFQVEEQHHRFKMDRPGGTAKMLQAEMERVSKKTLPEILVTRSGGIVGVHRVHATSLEDEITIEHRAFDRKVFARGALFAAKWLTKQNAGMYSMENVVS